MKWHIPDCHSMLIIYSRVAYMPAVFYLDTGFPRIRFVHKSNINADSDLFVLYKKWKFDSWIKWYLILLQKRVTRTLHMVSIFLIPWSYSVGQFRNWLTNIIVYKCFHYYLKHFTICYLLLWILDLMLNEWMTDRLSLFTYVNVQGRSYLKA